MTVMTRAVVTEWSLPITTLAPAQLSALPMPDTIDLSHPAVGTFTVLPDDGSRNRAMAEEIIFTIGRERFTLRTQRPLLPPILRLSGHAVDKPALQADPALAALVLEHLLTQALEAVEAEKGVDIQLLAIRRAEPDPDAMGQITRLRLVSDLWPAVVAAELQARTTAGDAILHQLFEGLSGPRPAAPLHLPAPLVLLSPAFQLPLAEMQALCPGDALLLDSRWSPEAEVLVVLPGTHFAAATWRGGRLHLTATPQRPPAKDTPPMTLSEPDAPFTVDELPVTVTLELDRIELPFSAIAELKQGSIVPFGTPMPETVRVLVNGRPFANAGLVQIDGKFGIRLTAMSGKPA